ncbi:hypothetical protein CGK74_17970 [Thauera propionica]|uniref:Recombinase family protein n=1 Tax=Thauera propionica TaxID=2019431 RepID=A0A235ETS3_9RHOO|nr:recombinase family protein [Thauera propionica]OYD52448.1 hypothetical protein CGK74_17970 [Thauera propionica]
MNQRCAIYVRYSDDQQRATSLDDQVRRCKEIALKNGISLEHVKIYQDVAITGKFEGEAKRKGLRRLLEDWDRQAFDVLLVDEFSRLSRDALTQAQIIRRLETSARVRMVTANGVDTTRPNWQLQLGLEGIVSQQSGRDTRHRVIRGMFGQLERGYMIGTPAYGYTLQRELDAAGNRIGSRWLINESEADMVRDVFERRARGESMHQIARSLNERGIPTRRAAREASGGYWRPSSVRNLLGNTIYKGVFIWNGSTTVCARAKKHGHVVEPVPFLRPELRIVSEELWERCNQKTISRSGYGGGRHALAGLVTCGCCESILAVTSKSRCRSLYCPRCTVAKSVISADERLTGTVATEGVQHLLIHAARHFLSEPFIEEFRAKLRAKLVGDVDEQLRAARVELARLEGAQERISRLIAADESEDPVLLARYSEARERAQTQRIHVNELVAGAEAVDREAIAAQIDVVDPLRVLDDLFDADIPAAQVRAVLSRLFPSVVLERKLSTYQSVFSVRFSPGVALAMLSDTKTIEEQEIELRFLLRYWPVHNFGEARWTVELLTPERPEVCPAVANSGVAV